MAALALADKRSRTRRTAGQTDNPIRGCPVRPPTRHGDVHPDKPDMSGLSEVVRAVRSDARDLPDELRAGATAAHPTKITTEELP